MSPDPPPVLSDNEYFNKLCLALYQYFTFFKGAVNKEFQQYEIWQVMLITVAFTLMSEAILNFLIQDEPLLSRLKKIVFSGIRRAPVLGGMIKKKVESAKQDMRRDGPWVIPHGYSYIKELPGEGLTDDEVFNVIESYVDMNDIDWSGGRCSGTIYCAKEDKNELLSEVYKRYCWTNPLHTECFKDVRKMEVEVCCMIGSMFNHTDAAGAITTGGSESILMSMKTHRDWARDTKGIDKPNVVLGITAHPAFDKAAKYFGIHLIHLPVDPVTFKVNPSAVARAINSNTICIVGSVPGYPHGIMDDIEALSEIAARNDIGLHVDACLGGFLIPFMEEAGFSLPLFDFRLPGVTAISVDTHKYGYTYKGSSVILYRTEKLREYQITVTTDWPGGIYASPTMMGSRPGANIAVTWAAMMSFGRDGYVKATHDIVKGARYLVEGLNSIPGVSVMGDPLISCVAWTSNVFDVYEMSGDLTTRGWNLATLQYPAGIHIALTQRHMQPGVINNLIKDVKEIAQLLSEKPPSEPSGAAAMYGLSAKIPDRSIVDEFGREFWNLYYSNDNTMVAPPK